MANKQEAMVILSPGFPKDEADTTCMPPQQIFVKALKEICPDLNVIVLTFQYPFYAADHEWHGVRVIAIGGKEKGRLLRAVTWAKAWRILVKLNRQYQVLGLLSFWFGECAFVGSYFAMQHRLKHYSWLLGQDAKKDNKYFKWIKPRGESLIALSDFLVREVKKNYGIMPAYVVPIGIDATLFNDHPVKRDIDILAAGSLIPLKQYHIFVETIAFVKQFFPGVKAVICGNGPEFAKLKALAQSLGLEDNLQFAGELPHAEVLTMMQRTKIFVHPSAYEGYGAVISEALYAGAHVVSFCKPMDRYFRHHHVAATEQEMKKATLAILKNSRRGHDRVMMCDIKHIAKNIVALFAE